MLVGDNHPNYGKNWINNGERQIFINANNIESYLEKGWKIGTLQKNKRTNSSHYHTTWVNINGINKRIDKNELSDYTDKGWLMGRVGLKKYKTKNEK